MAPITWYSKRQATVEASTFGSEFVALRVGMEMNDGLRYKLRMMGIHVVEPTCTLSYLLPSSPLLPRVCPLYFPTQLVDLPFALS